MFDLSRYKTLFISEAREHLDGLDRALIQFEKNPSDKALMMEMMRHSHTLKGIAAEMGYGELSNLAHSFEGMIENIKNGVTAFKGVSLLFGSLDEIRRLVDAAETSDVQTEANPLVDQVGELEEADKKNVIRRISEVKVSVERLDALMDISAELMIGKLKLQALARRLGESELSEAMVVHAKRMSALQDEVLQMRLTPIEVVFNRFPRMVRDLAFKEGKKVELLIRGGEIELDRSILDEIAEPLVHLLRNAIDHGLEGDGSIALTAEREANHVLIRIDDTGGGIDWKAVALKAGVSPELCHQDPAALKNLLFSGLSTAKHVTEISGRGVGLSVVRQKIESIGGTVDVVSPLPESDHGSRFVITLPVTLAIIRAILVRVGSQTFAVPMADVERLLHAGDFAIQRQARQAFILFKNEEVPLISLSGFLRLDNFSLPSERSMIFLTRYQDKPVGFLVDRIEGQQEIILKPLPPQLRSRGCFSAVTLLGDGVPVPIFDIDSLAHACLN